MIFAGPLFLQIYTVPGLCLLWTQNPLICLLGIVYPLAESIHKITKDGTDFHGVSGQIFLLIYITSVFYVIHCVDDKRRLGTRFVT